MTDHYETLGVERDASQQDIRAAYRRASMRAHPDREGGSEAAQQAVNAAFETLIDTERRAAYDEFGDESAGPSLARRAKDSLCALFDHVLNTNADDFLGTCRATAEQARNACAAKLTQLKHQRTQVEKRVGKVRAAEQDLFAVVVQRRIDNITAELERETDHLALHDAVQQLLSKYEQDPVAPPPMRASLNTVYWSTSTGASGL